MNFLSKMLSPSAVLNIIYKTVCVGSGTVVTLLLCSPALAVISQQSIPNSQGDTNFNTSPNTSLYQREILARRRRRSYRPPSGSRIPRRNHSGGGVRGCGEGLAAIAPRLSTIGQTVSAHPTLVWHTAAETPLPLELHLYRYTADDQLETVFIRAVEESQKGYMAYTLPAEEPGLQLGETYLWQVVLYCDENREEVGMWTAADIEVVSSEVVVDAAEIPADALGAAEAYADMGAWYDALAQVYGVASVEAKEFRQNLLLDLAELEEAAEQGENEAENEANFSGEISTQLRQLANL